MKSLTQRVRDNLFDSHRIPDVQRVSRLISTRAKPVQLGQRGSTSHPRGLSRVSGGTTQHRVDGDWSRGVRRNMASLRLVGLPQIRSRIVQHLVPPSCGLTSRLFQRTLTMEPVDDSSIHRRMSRVERDRRGVMAVLGHSGSRPAPWRGFLRSSLVNGETRHGCFLPRRRIGHGCPICSSLSDEFLSKH